LRVPAGCEDDPGILLPTECHRTIRERTFGCGHQDRRELTFDHRQHHLGLGIAETDVELDHLRTVTSEHQSGVKEAAILVALVAHAVDHRLDDLAHDATRERPIE
jgi:hypothetical protein